MAMSATRPLAVDFLDSVLRSTGDDAQRLTEVLVVDDSPLSSTTISESCTPRGVHVLAIRRDGRVMVNPSDDEVCLSGDSVVLVGNSKVLEAMEGKPE